MTTLKPRGRVAARKLAKVTIDNHDPKTVVGLIYRLTGDPRRVVVLICLLAALATILVLLLSVIAPPSVTASMAGGVSGGVILIGLIRQALRLRRR
jgi:hypothetical protein